MQSTPDNCSLSDDISLSNTCPQTNAISKSQLKKQLKRQEWIESRGERRRIEREKRKIKRRLLAQERATDLKDPLAAPSQDKRHTLMMDSNNKFRVVIDMDFNEFMTDSEISKAAQQVGRIYSTNRHSQNPCQLHISSLKDRVRDRFAITNTGYQNWDINCSDKGYLELFKSCDSLKEDVDKFIYLTGDSENTLPDVDTLLKDSSKIFVIGGLVDHNRHKNLCQERAVARGIPTARLPIKEHVALCQRHILSTLTVFEIMLKVLGSHTPWLEALLAAIPKRKIAQSVAYETADTDREGIQTIDKDNNQVDGIGCSS